MKKDDHAFVTAEPANEKPATAGAKQVAVIVCHGMGRQVPFETVDGVARLMRKAMRDQGNPDTTEDPDVKTRIVAHDGQKLGRAEVRYSTQGTAVDVHIYETYWAPLTAGKVGISDVYTFLKDAGFSGMDKALGGRFARYMFNKFQFFTTRFSTFCYFALALAVLVSLAFTSATVVAVGAARTITQGKSDWPGDGLMIDLTLDLCIFGIAAIVTGLLYWFAWRGQRKNNQDNESIRESTKPLFLNWLIVVAVPATAVAAIATAGLFVLHLLMARPTGAEHWWSAAAAVWFKGKSGILMLAIWLAILYVNEKIRKAFVEYIGDVAAYITPHAAHQFYEIRQAIQKSAKDVARAVYSMKDDAGAGFRYDRIVMIGHSLGSVVAYDTVNALMLDDGTAAAETIKAHARTSHLITFGSPLDKTAFIFRQQQEEDSQVRESLAANVQPLIRDYANREHLSWLNIWSRYDPISGPLDYYDRPLEPGAPECRDRVVNIRDAYSNIFLLAHTMYWQSPLLGKALLSAIIGERFHAGLVRPASAG